MMVTIALNTGFTLGCAQAQGVECEPMRAVCHSMARLGLVVALGCLIGLAWPCVCLAGDAAGGEADVVPVPAPRAASLEVALHVLGDIEPEHASSLIRALYRHAPRNPPAQGLHSTPHPVRVSLLQTAVDLSDGVPRRILLKDIVSAYVEAGPRDLQNPRYSAENDPEYGAVCRHLVMPALASVCEPSFHDWYLDLFNQKMLDYTLRWHAYIGYARAAVDALQFESKEDRLDYLMEQVKSPGGGMMEYIFHPRIHNGRFGRKDWATKDAVYVFLVREEGGERILSKLEAEWRRLDARDELSKKKQRRKYGLASCIKGIRGKLGMSVPDKYRIRPKDWREKALRNARELEKLPQYDYTPDPDSGRVDPAVLLPQPEPDELLAAVEALGRLESEKSVPILRSLYRHSPDPGGGEGEDEGITALRRTILEAAMAIPKNEEDGGENSESEKDSRNKLKPADTSAVRFLQDVVSVYLDHAARDSVASLIQYAEDHAKQPAEQDLDDGTEYGWVVLRVLRGALCDAADAAMREWFRDIVRRPKIDRQSRQFAGVGLLKAELDAREIDSKKKQLRWLGEGLLRDTGIASETREEDKEVAGDTEAVVDAARLELLAEGGDDALPALKHALNTLEARSDLSAEELGLLRRIPEVIRRVRESGGRPPVSKPEE